MAIGQSNNPNFNVQSPSSNQTLVYDSTQQAFVNTTNSASGAVTGATNQGAGKEVFKQLSGTDLQMRSLTAGSGISLAQGTDDIVITASSTVTGAANIGTGTGFFKQLNSGSLEFKTLAVGTGLALANSATEVTLTLANADIDAGKVGGQLASAFLTKADNLASVGSTATSRTNLSVYSKAEIDAFTVKNNGNILPDGDLTRDIGNNSYRFNNIYANTVHGTATSAGSVASLSNREIGDLQNVDTSGVAANTVLGWNGSKWVPTSTSSLISTTNFALKSNNLSDLGSSATARTNLGVYSKTETDNRYFSKNAGGLPGGDNTIDLGNNSYRFANIYAVAFQGTATNAGTVNSIANHDLGDLQNVDTSGKASGHVLSWNGSKWVSSADSSPSSLAGLSDVDASGIANGQVLKYNSSTSKYEPGDASGSGATTFVGLTDTPANFSGAASRFVKVNAAGNALEFVAKTFLEDLSGLNTGNLTEGSNLYFTNARADARIGAASINALSDVDTSGISSGQVLSWNGSSFVAASTGAGDITAVIAGTGLTGGATSGSATLNVDVGTGANKIVQLDGTGKLPSVDGSNLTGISASTTFVALTDTPANFSGASSKFVKVNSAGNALEYVADPGYLTSETFTSLVQDTTPQLGGTLDANGQTIDMGTNVLTDANLGQFITAYGWGNHASAGYLTSVPAQSFASLSGKPTTIAGYGITDAFDGAFGSLTGKPTTIAGYGITNLNASIDAHLNQSNPTSGYVLSWNGSDYAWVANSGGGGGGDITAVVAGTGLTGGATSGSATLNVDVGTSANKIVQLDGSARLPAVDGSQLTNIDYTVGVDEIKDTMIDFGTGTGQVSTADIPESTNLYYTDARFDTRLSTKSTTNLSEGTNLYYTDARVDTRFDTRLATKDTGDLAEGSNLYFTNARADARISNAVLSALSNVHTAAPSDGQVLAWDNANSRWAPSNTGAGDITAVVAGTGLTGGATSGSATLNVDAGTSADKIVQLDGSARLPAVDGRALTNLLTNYDTDVLTEGSSNLYFTNARADARITAASIGSLADVNTSGVATNKILKYNGSAWVVADDTDTVYSTFNSDFDTRLGTKSTTNLAEGSNLYFTNARADARVQAASLTDLSNVDAVVAGDDGKILYYDHSSTSFKWKTESAGGSVAGSNTQVQFNDSGSFGGDSGFTYNKTTDTVTAGSFTASGGTGSITATGALGITSGSNNDITITPNGTGDIILDGQKWPQADGSSGQYLKTNGSGQLSWGSVTGGPADTDAISEGSSNLYFTNARAIAAVQGTNLNMGSNNITTTGKILFSNVYSAEADLPSASTYHGMFAHVHATGKGYFAHAGNWIPLANESALSSYQTTAGLNASIDSHLNQSGPSSGHVLSWNGSDYAWVAQSGPADTDALSEGSSNLYFTNARADARITNALKDEDNMASNSATHIPSQQSVKAYVDAQVAGKDNTDEITEGSTNLYFTNGRADARIGAANIADLNNVNNASPTDGQVLTWDNSNSYWKPVTPSAGGSTAVERFKINYSTTGALASISDKTSGISSVSIDSAAGGDITINFTGYSYPPASILLYGYKYASNVYDIMPWNKDVTLRQVPGGGSSGSPTAFGSISSIKIKAAEADTGASRSFGTVTHAWIQLVMGG